MRTLTLGLVLLFGCHAAPEVKRPGTLMLSLSRGECFGACPMYVVEVWSDGLLKFKGERHVKIVEPIEVMLDPATLDKLTARLAQSSFSTWGNFLRPDMTDQPTVELTFNGKSVRHNHGDSSAPEEVKKLEDDVDAILGTDRWVNGTGTATQ